MFDRLSEDALESIAAARQAALEWKHDYVGTEHVLLGVASAAGSVAMVALGTLGIDAARVRAEVTKVVRPGTVEITGEPAFTPRALCVLELSLAEAQDAGHDYIGTGHILLAVLREGAGIAAQALVRLGATLDGVRTVVRVAMQDVASPHDGPPADPPAVSSSLLEVLGVACQEAARGGSPETEPEHVLVALIEGEGAAARVLRELGATADGVRRRVRELRAE